MGITNAPQGGGSSGGGEWTLRTPNKDWTDLFEVSGSDMTAKKDIYMFPPPAQRAAPLFIPKGMTQASFRFVMGGVYKSGNNLVQYVSLYFTAPYVGSNNSYIEREQNTISFTTDGSSISITTSSNHTNIFDKNNMVIYTRE